MTAYGHTEKEEHSVPVSRVLFLGTLARRGVCHLSTPRITPWLKRSTLHRYIKSDGQPSDDGLRELAASSEHSLPVT